VPTPLNALTPLRLIYADDDPAMRLMIKTMLGLVDGVEVVGEAVDGEEAIRLVREHEPDLVLLDVQMPGLDGPSAAEMIRALRPKTRVVLHTALPTAATQRRAERLGLPLLDKLNFDHVIEAITEHAPAGGEPDSPDAHVEAAVLAALTARASQPMFLVLADGAVPFYNHLAGELLDLPLPMQPASIDELRLHFEILRPDGTQMPVPERLMYRAIGAHTPLIETVIVAAGGRETTARAAAIPFFANDDSYVGTAIYFEPL
jgi:DNA-binding NarL/FixJ family response regulator